MSEAAGPGHGTARQSGALPIETDALVIGAGPVGLFQVFQLGLLNIRAQVVEALGHVGGQCVELYGDKPIYDIPGLPFCTARELVERLQQQVAPFQTGYHFNQLVESVAREPDGRFLVRTNAHTEFRARVVIIAAGVGAFMPRKLQIDGASACEGKQVIYHPTPDQLGGAQRVLVLGGGADALACALEQASQSATEVTVLHRRDVFDAPSALLSEFRAACDTGRIRLKLGQPIALRHGDDGTCLLDIVTTAGEAQSLRASLIAAYLGLSPRLGPLAHWGLAMERKQLVVNTENFGSSEPGIFAVGDVNTYPGKKKLILSGFHESALAAFGAAAIVFPDKPAILEYTTTSTRLHRLLGVESKPVI